MALKIPVEQSVSAGAEVDSPVAGSNNSSISTLVEGLTLEEIPMHGPKLKYRYDHYTWPEIKEVISRQPV